MRKLTICLATIAVLCACGREERRAEKFGGFALGTTWEVTVVGSAPQGVERKIDSVFAALTASMSVFDEGSLLSRLNRNETDSVDVHIARNIAIAREAGELSGGSYDITIQPLVEAYGFSGAEQSTSQNIDSLLRYVGYRNIEVRDGRLVKKYPQVRIGLNSVAKGYAVDLIGETLEKCGVEEYLVNVGGEIFCRGRNARGEEWRVAVDTPFEGNYVGGAHTTAVLEVSGVGMATSGNYRNFHTGPDGGKYTHIIDPLTGANTDGDLLSATVVAESCARADALGTMFMAMGLERSRELLASEEIAALLIYSPSGGEGMEIFASPAMEKYLEVV